MLLLKLEVRVGAIHKSQFIRSVFFVHFLNNYGLQAEI